MTVYRDDDIKNINLKNTAIAIGGFDALHVGHMKIVGKAVENAKKFGLKSLVVMFENNPLNVIAERNIKAINSVEKRIAILDSVGADGIALLKFDTEIMQISKEEFFKKYIVDKFGAKSVSVGFNFKFGKNGSGDIEYLKKECLKNSINIDIVPEVKVFGKTVSSTIIRELVAKGDVAAAEKYLGRPFSLSGTVVKGNQIGGKLLGFPTANIEMPADYVIPKYGVYVSQTIIDRKKYLSITNVGNKPTVEKDRAGIETHITDASFEALYNKKIEVEFCEFIRDIRTFKSTDELKSQLEKDKLKAKNIKKECF